MELLNSPVAIWTIILIGMILIELVTQGLTTIWFAGGALIALVLALAGTPVWVQVAAFLAVSILLLVFTRPLAQKYFNTNRSRTNVESLVGKEAIVLEEIDNIRESGKIKLNGLEWTARSFGGENIPKDSIVTVHHIEGVKAIVELKA